MNNILSGKLASRGNLNGNVNTIVFAHNYNDLTNKPQINNVTLQGNKTATELGLATPEDITVTSVNEQTGDVVLSGSDIDYSEGLSLNAKIDDLESQITVSGVQSVNGMTGNVTLTSNDIDYSTGVTIKDKIDSVEGEIPDEYVSSVNGNSGAVTLTGSDIEYSSGVTINNKIDAVESEIPVVSYPVTSVNSKTGAVVLDDTDIEHSSGVSVNSLINTIMNYTPVYGNTASGAIATFDTSLALPLQDCTIDINGTDLAGANIKVAGNLLNGNKVQVGDRTVRLGELAGNTYSTHLLATTYTISFTRPTDKAFRFDLIDSNNTVTTLIPFSSTNNSVTFDISTEGDYCFSIYLYAGVLPTDIDNVMLVGGSSVKPYTAYTAPNTTAISWGYLGTVSEGSLNVTTGKLTVVTGSMGAGDYQITPIPINQLSGTNNVFCDTGDTSVVYACSLKDYIDSQ